jgi:prepilin peptidase CpaA
MHPGSVYCLQTAIAALLVFAALRDIATRLVPNWVSIAILICGIVLQTVVGVPFTAAGLGLLIFLLAALMWSRGWLGGADVKLLATASVAVAPAAVVPLMLAISLAGGGLAIVYIILSRLLRRPSPGPRNGFLPRLLKAEAWRIHKRAPLPYAVAIAIGGILTLFPSQV